MNIESTEGAFFAEDGTDEVVYAGIDEVIAVFVFGRNWVWCAFQLGILLSDEYQPHVASIFSSCRVR